MMTCGEEREHRQAAGLLLGAKTGRDSPCWEATVHVGNTNRLLNVSMQLQPLCDDLNRAHPQNCLLQSRGQQAHLAPLALLLLLLLQLVLCRLSCLCQAHAHCHKAANHLQGQGQQNPRLTTRPTAGMAQQQCSSGVQRSSLGSNTALTVKTQGRLCLQAGQGASPHLCSSHSASVAERPHWRAANPVFGGAGMRASGQRSEHDSNQAGTRQRTAPRTLMLTSQTLAANIGSNYPAPVARTVLFSVPNCQL